MGRFGDQTLLQRGVLQAPDVLGFGRAEVCRQMAHPCRGIYRDMLLNITNGIPVVWFSCLDQGWGRIQVLLCLIFVLSFCHVFSRMPWLSISTPACGHWKSHAAGVHSVPDIAPTLGTWLRHLPVENGLLHTVFFSRAASALSVALNFCDTTEASAKEGRAQVSDTVPPFSLLFHFFPPTIP